MDYSLSSGVLIDAAWFGDDDDAIKERLEASSESQLQRLYAEVQQMLGPQLQFIVERGRREYDVLVRLTEEIREGGDAPAPSDRIPARAEAIATAIATLPAARMAVIELLLSLPDVGAVLEVREWSEAAVDRAGTEHMARMAGLEVGDVHAVVEAAAEYLCGCESTRDGLPLYFNDRLMTIIGHGDKVEVDRARATVVCPRARMKLSGGATVDKGSGLLIVTPVDGEFTLSYFTRHWPFRSRGVDAKIITGSSDGWAIADPHDGLVLSQSNFGHRLGSVGSEMWRSVVVKLSDNDEAIAELIDVEPVL